MAYFIVAGALLAFAALWRAHAGMALMALALVGGAVQEGWVGPPPELGEPVAELRREVVFRQDRQAERLSCHVAVSRALAREEDLQTVAAAQRLCARAR